jgi:hypothetical protein
LGTTGIIVLIAVGGVVFVVGLMWFLRHLMDDLKAMDDPKEPERSIEEHNPLGDRTATGAEFGSRLPTSVPRPKGDNSVIHEFVETSRIDSNVMGVLWVVVAVLAVVAAVMLVYVFFNAETALQEVSAATFALALAGVPYVLVRAIKEFSDSGK